MASGNTLLVARRLGWWLVSFEYSHGLLMKQMGNRALPVRRTDHAPPSGVESCWSAAAIHFSALVRLSCASLTFPRRYWAIAKKRLSEASKSFIRTRLFKQRTASGYLPAR